MRDYKISESIDYERLKDLRLYAFFSFTVWPFVILMGLFAAIYNILKGLLTLSKGNISRAYDNLSYTVALPFYLIKCSYQENVLKAFLAVILLLPFMLAATISPFFLCDGGAGAHYGISQPPCFYRLFDESGEGLFGTNGEGIKIERIILMGAGYTYFTSLIAVGFVFICGIWLGKLTFYKRAEFYIMGFVETIESLPILFLLLVVLAVLGWWENEWKNLGILFQYFGYALVIVTIGLVIGIGFLPRMIRLIRERIKTFVSESFVDGLKAHGIEQDRILWSHIIKKNCMGDIIISFTQIWGAVILIGISLDYLISIFPLLGARNYSSWTQLLLSPETKKAILFLKELKFNEWWLYVFPIFFIVTTITGFYLFGDGIKAIHDRRLVERKNRVTKFDHMVHNISVKIGI